MEALRRFLGLDECLFPFVVFVSHGDLKSELSKMNVNFGIYFSH